VFFAALSNATVVIKNDTWIRELADRGGIAPFEPQQVRRVDDRPVISYGLSSFGYDIRLSPNEFRIFRHIPGTVVDPKNFNPENLETAALHRDDSGEFFILPAHSYGLGVAIERLEVPDNVTILCVGKSTYARAGIIANLTPAEACMSEDTEILAKTGWKLLKDVIIGEQVLTLNPDTGCAEYKAVEDTQAYYFNGELLNFKSRYVDQLVTPQHRMWAGKRARQVVSAGDGRKDKQKGVQRQATDRWDWGFSEAKDIFGKWNYYLSRNVQWSGVEPPETVSFGQHTFPFEAWCKFIGIWMGDGSAFYQEGGNYVIKLAVVTKDNKREYFRTVLTEMGVNYRQTSHGFEFHSKAVCEYLQTYKYAKNKHIPQEIKQLPPYFLNLVIEGMMYSDGNLESSTYGSASKRLVDDFQEIAIKAGFTATSWTVEGFSEFTQTHSVQYKCRISKPRSTPNKLLPSNQEKVPYTGFVYDVTVPNHIFLSRRNGRASWTGNSWKGHLTLEFSNSSSADCRMYAREGVVQLLFFEGDPCSVSYEDRQGKYQNQNEEVTIARI
jgi:dCTP deaminase